MGHAGLVLAAGGNDICGNDVFNILQKFRACITMLRQSFPNLRIAIAMILPRPGDVKGADEKKRRAVNAALKRLCKRENIWYMNTFKAISVKQQVDLSNYANDQIHLSRRGIVKLRSYMIGAVAHFMGYTC